MATQCLLALAAAATPRLSAHDVVCALSVFVTASALLPAAEVLFRINSAVSTHDKLRTLSALTPLDQCALLAGVAAAGVALAQLALLVQSAAQLSSKQAPTPPTTTTLLLLRASGAALAAATLATTLLLAAVLVTQEHASVWGRTHAFVNNEAAFEARVNDVYCHIKGAQICELGSLAEAKDVFPLSSWPVGMASQPGKTIRSSCHGFDDSVRQWGYPIKMELCRVCNAITAEEQRGGEELLHAVEDISLQELQWCGAYLVADERAASHTTPELRMDDDDVDALASTTKSISPYKTHRAEFQQLLLASQPRFTLALGVPALAGVVASAVPCLLVLFYALAAASRAGTATFSRKEFV